MPGRIPQSFINDLIERVDIVEVIDSRVSLKRAGKNLQALCPFHEEKTPSFSVNPEKQFYYCFGCGATGTSLRFLMEYEGLEFVDAVETLAQIAGVEVPREAGSRKQIDTDLYEILSSADRYYRSALRDPKLSGKAVEYLQSRGINGVTARDFGIGFAPAGWDGLKQALTRFPESKLIEAGMLVRNDAGRVYDRFRERITFPIRDTRGRVVGFGGRVLGDEKPKYLNSPETEVFQKSRELYGLFEARRALRELPRLLVVEGYMDVVALAQHGIPNAVATLGTATGQTHYEKLFRYTREIVCCFDGDSAGRGAAWKALSSAFPVLQEGRQLRFMFVGDGEDPDTLIRSEGEAKFNQHIEASISAGDYFFREIASGLDLTSMDARARLADLALPLIGKLPDGLYRRMMVERLSREAQISIAAIEKRVGVSFRARTGESVAGPPESKISRKLASYLVHEPTIAEGLSAAMGKELIAISGDTLLSLLLRRVLEQNLTDTSTLLASFVGEPEHDVMVGLTASTPSLSGEALKNEFIDGVRRFLEERNRDIYRSLAQDLHDDDSSERLAVYWKARRERDTGNVSETP
ncbi:MAG: DNA primase [Pseudomonadales bacterium]|nr:DNA primase [Pseudomonadales bacterium]